MFNTDNISPIQIKLLEGQVDLILRALELYAFNLHHTWSVDIDSDKEELRNSLIFYTYNMLLEYKRDKTYRIAYDFIGEYKNKKHNAKLKEYRAKKNIA